MINLLNRLFNVQRDEWSRLLLLYLMAFLFIAGITWGETVAEGSFLARSGTQGLPYIFIADAVFSIIAVAIYTAFIDRYPHSRVLIGISLVSASTIALGMLLMYSLDNRNLAYQVLYLLSRVVRESFNLHWWTYVNSFYDTRSAKRIIPILSSASRVATIFAGWSTPVLLHLLQSSGVVGLWIATLVVIALLAGLMPLLLKGRSARREIFTAAPTSYAENIREGYRFVSQSKYLRWMAVSAFLLMVLLALLLFQSYAIFESRFNSPAEISGYLGRLKGTTSLIMLPIQLFLFSRILGRAGLGNTNMIFPIGTALISANLIVFPREVYSAALAYFNAKDFRTGFRNTADNLLYNAVPVKVKGRARAFISGLVMPLGSLAGGAMLLLLYDQPAHFILGLIGACTFVYVCSAELVRRTYSQALIGMLEQEDFSFLLSISSEWGGVGDANTLQWLQHRLDESSSNDLTIFMAKILYEMGGSDTLPVLEELATTRDVYVRLAIMDILAASPPRGESALAFQTAFWKNLLDDPDPRVRRSAIAGLAQITDAKSEELLQIASEMLEDEDYLVRGQVIPLLMQSGELFYLAAAAQTLTEMLRSQDATRREVGVDVLGEIGELRFIKSLVDFLDDESPEVRQAAIEAIQALTLARKDVPDKFRLLLFEHIPPLLQDPAEQVRLLAVSVLGNLPDQSAQQYLLPALVDKSSQVRETAVNALAAYGTKADAVLLPELQSTEAERRKMATVVLARIYRQEYLEALDALVLDNLRQIYRHLIDFDTLQKCKGLRGIDVMLDALLEANHELLEEVFYMLGALHGQEPVLLIREALESDNMRTRANAAEALESLINPQMLSVLIPLFEPSYNLAARAAFGRKSLELRGDTIDATLQRIATRAENPLFRAITVWTLGEVGELLAQTSAENPAPPPTSSPASSTPPKRASGLDGLMSVLADLGAQDSPSPEAESPVVESPPPAPKPRRRRASSKLSLNALFDRMDSSEGESEKDQSAAEAAPAAASAAMDARQLCATYFTPQQITDILQVAVEDADSEVRVAARAAIRQISGGQLARATHQEEPMLSIIEKIIFLKEVSFFQSMTVEQLKAIAGVCEEEVFAEDQVIFYENDPGGVLYVVVSGKVGIERQTGARGSVRLATIEANSYFGEMTLFDNTPRAEMAIALQQTLTLRLRREPVIALTRRYPDLAIELIKLLSQRLRESNDQIASLTRTRSREIHKVFDKLD